MFYASILLPCLRIAFIGTLLIFFLSWFIRKILRLIFSWKKTRNDKELEEDEHKKVEYNIRQDAWKENIQQKYIEKATKYKENIQIPREREKRERKEKEFYKYYDQLWRGGGNTLGGEEEFSDGNDDTTSYESTRAARRRKLPESEPSRTEEIPKPKTRSTTKRVIELPEEPIESDPETILVIMRTPISTVVKRRFRLCHSFQNVLDFMTVSGFSQAHHQLCTSFPRQVLSPDPEMYLSDLGFGRRVTLNIENKADDES